MSGFVPSKLRGLAVVLGLTALFFTLALARGSGSAPSRTVSVPAAKIAVVAFQAAVGQTNEAQKEFAALQQRFAPKEAQLKNLEEEIEKMKKQLEAEGDKLSESERSSRANTISEKQKTYQHNHDEAQAEFQQEMQESYNTTAAKVYDVLAKYAQENGITLVLDVSHANTQMLYAVGDCDITKDLIAVYNATPPATPKTPAK